MHINPIKLFFFSQLVTYMTIYCILRGLYVSGLWHDVFFYILGQAHGEHQESWLRFVATMRKSTLDAMKTKRAQCLAIIWGNADSIQPDRVLDPLSYRWKKENRHFTPDWLPDLMSQLIFSMRLVESVSLQPPLKTVMRTRLLTNGVTTLRLSDHPVGPM